MPILVYLIKDEPVRQSDSYLKRWSRDPDAEILLDGYFTGVFS